MTVKSSTLCVASKQPGKCGGCRHANQDTVDFREQHVFCQWGGGARSATAVCDIKRKLPIDAQATQWGEYYLFEPFDGANGTWGRLEDSRILAEDAAPERRASLKADRAFIPAGD